MSTDYYFKDESWPQFGNSYGVYDTQYLDKGVFVNYIDKIFAFFFDHLRPTYPGLTFVKEFLYCYIMEYRWHFQYHLPSTSSCQRK